MSDDVARHDDDETSRGSGLWRWLLLAAGWLAAIAVLVWIWSPADATRQAQNLKSAMVLMAAGGGTFAWIMLFSGWQWRTRRNICIAVAVLCVLLAATVRIEGVSGDFMPILSWRWSNASADNTVRLRSMDANNIAPPTAQDVAQSMPGLADYPQFLGPDRNAKVDVAPPEVLAKDWSANPPREVWRRGIGDGWSAFAIAGPYAVTQEQVDGKEVTTCFDVTNGNVIWFHEDEARYESTVAGTGPRATPTIHEGNVYTVGSTGVMNCLDLITGEDIWSVNIFEDNNAEPLEWGFSGSPLVEGDMVIINPGGSHDRATALAAYHKDTGEKIWAAGYERGTYASPVIMTLQGVRQIVMQNYGSITGHAIDTGEVLWNIPWRGQYPKVANPVLLPGDRILASSGYGVGAAVFQINRDDSGAWSDDLVWRNKRLSAKFTNIIHHDGYIYGLDDGIMVCLDAETGERMWKGGRYGHGQMILAGDVLLVTTEMGDALLIEPTPDELRELSRMTVFDGVKSWNTPALAGRYLFWRNDREAVCYALPVAE